MSCCNCKCNTEIPEGKIQNKNRDTKVKRLLIWILLLFLIIFIIGFKYLFDLDWHDAIYNAALTTSTLGVDINEKTKTQKYFIAFYALISGILFISLISAFIDHIVDVYQT